MNISFLLPRKWVIAFVLSTLTTALIAQIPENYYSNAEGKYREELKNALYGIIKGHTQYPYTSTSTDVWDILKETDRDTVNPDNVILIYSGLSVNAAQEYNNTNGWTREHVWAKSHGDFGTDPGAGTDAHHIRPECNTINNLRNSRWFAESDEPVYYNNQFTGCYKGSTEWTWEPRDAVKGDIARMIFYMATRYEGENGEPDLEMVDYIPADNNTIEPIHAKLSDLLLWNTLDPVDAFEMNRNEVVFSYQHNRNPFIDHPEYANYIWGDDSFLQYSPVISSISQNPEVPTSKDTVIIIANVSDANNNLSTVSIKWGENQPDNITDMVAVSDTVFVAKIPPQIAQSSVVYQVEAIDSTDRSAISQIYSYTVVEVNSAPVISGVYNTPDRPNQSNVVTVYADVFDADGNLSGVNLVWGLHIDAMVNIFEMENNSQGHYATIPAQNVDSTIYFKIVAFDLSQDTTISEIFSYTICSSTDIIYNMISEVDVYPNPFKSTINVDVKDLENCTVKIFNVIGELVYSSGNEMNKTIYLTHIPRGVYILHLEQGDRRKTIKIVKQ